MFTRLPFASGRLFVLSLAVLGGFNSPAFGTGLSVSGGTSSTSYNFGTSPVGATYSQTLTVTSSSKISQLTTSSLSAPFSYASNTCAGSLASGGKCSIVVTWTASLGQSIETIKFTYLSGKTSGTFSFVVSGIGYGTQVTSCSIGCLDNRFSVVVDASGQTDVCESSANGDLSPLAYGTTADGTVYTIDCYDYNTHCFGGSCPVGLCTVQSGPDTCATTVYNTLGLGANPYPSLVAPVNLGNSTFVSCQIGCENGTLEIDGFGDQDVCNDNGSLLNPVAIGTTKDGRKFPVDCGSLSYGGETCTFQPGADICTAAELNNMCNSHVNYMKSADGQIAPTCPEPVF